MANLNGHEVGNDGHSQEEPVNHYDTILLDVRQDKRIS